ncbi:MAG: OmpH family outer membrane protein [Erythrobacter sp.]
MKIFAKTLALAGLTVSAAMAVPATAQVQGNYAIVDVATVVVGTTAFQTAYQQIATTYQPQIDTRRARGEQRQTLLQQLDTNNDGQFDEAEQTAAANTPQVAQIQALDQEIQTLSAQIDGARVFAVEQILAQYPAAMQEVVEAQQLQLVLSPENVIFAAPEADVSALVTTSLNAKVPSVAIVPAQGWQPNRNSVALYQQIQQLLLTAQAIQQQQAAQQPQQPATQAPSGR